MEETGILLFEVADERQEGESVDYHGERAALGYSSAAEEGEELISLAMDDKEGVVLVGVESKEGSTGPFMAGYPEHEGTVDLLEGIGGIHFEKSIVLRG